MSAWIAQVDNANPGTASMHNLQDSLRSTLGGGSVHIRAETEASARVMAAKVLGCRGLGGGLAGRFDGLHRVVARRAEVGDWPGRGRDEAGLDKGAAPADGVLQRVQLRLRGRQHA